ncbi:unnamed protein product [Linum trigynum]|uniref:Exostosin GT47 domain-containing protein n=1 Tax=Linum trigynum TaxID=586398 RepID=A0AAV2DPF7_9ROSI
METLSSNISLALLILILIYIWSTSTTIMSGNSVHVCVSSRKLNNLYCISAGTKPGFNLPILPNTSIGTIKDGTGTKHDEDHHRDFVVDEDVIEQHIRLHRSWSSEHTGLTSSCTGRRVYVYDLPTKFNKDLLIGQCGDKCFDNGGLGKPIEKLGKGWYDTHHNFLEPIFHSRVLNHQCRVHNEDEAMLFYVPYYGGLWHLKNVSRDTLDLDLIKWLESKKSWSHNFGKDHVFVLGLGTTRFLHLAQMKNPTKLLIERELWDVNQIGIPSPTYFHPHSDDDILSLQLQAMRSPRRSLVSLIGSTWSNQSSYSNNIISMLIKQCVGLPTELCKFLDCGSGECNRPELVIELFMESEFCLHPPGDRFTRKWLFDSLVSGCIPVLFSPFTAYYQYPWHLPEEDEKYSVFLDQEEVMQQRVNVVERVMRTSSRHREDMRRFIVYELLPGLVYGDSSSQLVKFRDSFSITLDNLIKWVNRLE